MEDRCVVCGDVIPEGRQVCPNCENGYAQLIKNFTEEVRGFGAKKAAKLSGVSYSTVLGWINSHHAPNLEHAQRVANAIGMEFLLFDKEK